MNCSVCGRPLGKEEEEKGLCTHCSNNEDKTSKNEVKIIVPSFLLGLAIGFVAAKSTKNKS